MYDLYVIWQTVNVIRLSRTLIRGRQLNPIVRKLKGHHCCRWKTRLSKVGLLVNFFSKLTLAKTCLN